MGFLVKGVLVSWGFFSRIFAEREIRVGVQGEQRLRRSLTELAELGFGEVERMGGKCVDGMWCGCLACCRVHGSV